MPYNPLDDITPGSTIEEKPFDAFSEVKPLSSTPSAREAILPFGKEREVMEDAPWVYDVIKVGLGFVPGARYALPSEREKFNALSPEEKVQAVGVEALGAALWAGTSMTAIKAGQKAAKWAFGQKAVKKILPIEDAVRGIGELAPELKWSPFNYAERLNKKLKSMGFAKEEADAVSRVMLGESEDLLKNAYISRKYLGKDPTGAFKEATRWVKGQEYVGPWRGPQLKLALSRDTLHKLSSETLQSKHYQKLFRTALGKEVYGGKYPVEYAEVALKAGAKKFIGEDLGKAMTFDQATPELVTNVVLDMLRDKRAVWNLTAIGRGRVFPVNFTPSRVIFGTGEETLGTYQNIYKPGKAAIGEANSYTFDRVLLWQKKLEELQLGKVKFDKFGGFSFSANFGAADQKAAYDVLLKTDEIMRPVYRGATEEVMLEKAAEVTRLVNTLPKGGASRLLVEAWNQYSDVLYGEFVSHKLRQVFVNKGLTAWGHNSLDYMLRELNPKVANLFATSAGKSHADKVLGLKEILSAARKRLVSTGDAHPWFTASGDTLKRQLSKLEKELTLGGANSRGTFLPYLENYTARLAERGAQYAQEWKTSLMRGPQAFFTKAKKIEPKRGAPVDFATMIEARLRAQGKEMFVYPVMDDIVKYAEKLPPAWREYTEHWMARILHMPSTTDYKVAEWLTKGIGGIEKRLGGTGIWDADRVMQLGQTVNDFTYMGALGFKPFSAVRNLFQPLLTVPADLGGLKGLGHLVAGAKKAMNPKTREYIRSLGAITDYAPEAAITPHALPGMKEIGGFALPSTDRVRDFAMWMFRGSDRWNRYVSGGAAMNKWETALGKMGKTTLDSPEEIKRFIGLLGLKKRNPWVATEIEDNLRKSLLEDNLRRGLLDEAKKIWVSDVIADTQYLYGAADAPIVTGKAGIIGKTGMIFQTWWMNYGTLIEKWMRTGEVPADKIGVTITGMFSAAIAEQAMEQVWDRKRAMKSVGLGVFPSTVDQYMIPPSWTPIYHAVGALLSVQEPEKAVGRLKQILDSGAILVPGGLQMKQMWRGAEEEGFKGFSKSILGIKPGS